MENQYYQCSMCVNNTECIIYQEKYVCIWCAKEYGLETPEETEKRSIIWWRNNFEMLLKRKITEAEWKILNPYNYKEPWKGCDECDSSDCIKNYEKI